MNVTIIHCDKCDSTDVLHETVPTPRQETHQTMSEVVESSSKKEMEFCIYSYTRYRMVCKDCGHIVRYQR